MPTIQVKVLREICSENITVDEFLSLLKICRPMVEEGVFAGAMARIAAAQQGGGAQASSGAVKTRRVSGDVDWFCHLAVSEGLLTKEACLVLSSICDADNELMGLAQVLISEGGCDDLMRVQNLVDRAIKSAATGEPPPESVFG